MTVREKIEETISSADKDMVKGSVKAIFGGLVMAAGLKMFGDGIQKAERNVTLVDVFKGTRDAFDSETLDKTWKED